MKYSVVIPSLGTAKTKPYLKLCVESLRESGFDGQIIVVTNGTPSPEDLNIRGISTRLHTKTQGQCNAVNIGAQLVDTEYMMVSNDDMFYFNNWSQHLRFDHPVFSPNLVEPIDNAGSADPFLKADFGNTIETFKQSQATNLMNLWSGLAHADKKHLISKDSKNIYAPNGLQEPGFNLPFFIKKDLWTLLRGYDTAFDPWGSNSDTDLQTRINEAGVTPMRLRDVLVYHFSNKSGTFDGTHQDFYQNNIEYFGSKHGFDRDELGSDVWYNKDMLPKDKSKIKYKQGKYEQA